MNPMGSHDQTRSTSIRHSVSVMGPHRVMLWPLDLDRYGLDLTFHGSWACEDAEAQAARLGGHGMPNMIRREADGGWTVRLGPLHSLQVAQALSSVVG